MSNFTDITGKKFFRFTVVAYVGRNNSGNALWECICDCGNTRIVCGSNLRLGRHKSCGCLQVKHGMANNQLYPTWIKMLRRCHEKSDKDYRNYGGRGIVVCDRWKDVANFIDDMLPTYRLGLQLDRKDTDGPYSPENCHWATPKQQQRNRRNNRLLTFAGTTKCMSAWAEEYDIEWDTLYRRIGNGMELSEALIKPVRRSFIKGKKRPSRLLTYHGSTRSVAEWSRLTGLGEGTIASRINRGLSIEEALSLPLQPGKRLLNR